MFDLILKGGEVFDGSGNESIVGDIAIKILQIKCVPVVYLLLFSQRIGEEKRFATIGVHPIQQRQRTAGLSCPISFRFGADEQDGDEKEHDLIAERKYSTRAQTTRRMKQNTFRSSR